MIARIPQLTERPPIVAVLGHVDHGKSTLLDFIRKTNTVEKEAGGITQHVAAYEATHQGKQITFIDTPGHAAFGSIRARGANVADIAILVVAADDGVKTQTLEALASIKSADIPFVVAINKIDMPNANIERTKASLMENGVFLEKLGGDVPWTAISAKTGAGVDELLDLILLVAELRELKGDPVPPASGYVIEAHRDTKRGIAATLIITNGVLKQGMAVRAGSAVSPVRIMEDHAGVTIREANFSKPIRLTGFDELPEVGSAFSSYKNKREAEKTRPDAIPIQPGIASRQTSDVETTEEGGHFALSIIIRADTTGSLEAVAHEIARIGDEHSSVRIVQSGVGNISENDVKTAAASPTRVNVIGFNVGVERIAEERARQSGVTIETFDIIYKLTERIEEILRKTRPKREMEEIVGRARILKQFSSQKNTRVIGGSVSEGYIVRNASVRIQRRNTTIGVGKLKNLQSHKQNVERVETGSEFGAQVESVFEIAQGDILECFTTSTV